MEVRTLKILYNYGDDKNNNSSESCIVMTAYSSSCTNVCANEEY